MLATVESSDNPVRVSLVRKAFRALDPDTSGVLTDSEIRMFEAHFGPIPERFFKASDNDGDRNFTPQELDTA